MLKIVIKQFNLRRLFNVVLYFIDGYNKQTVVYFSHNNASTYKQLNKTVEDVFILILYVVSDLFIIGSYLYGHYFKKEMLTHSRSTRSSNRWIKG